MSTNCSIWSNESKNTEKQACSLIQDVLGCGHNVSVPSSLIKIEDYKEPSDGLTSQTNETVEYIPIGIEDETDYYIPIGIENKVNDEYNRTQPSPWLNSLLLCILLLYVYPRSARLCKVFDSMSQRPTFR